MNEMSEYRGYFLEPQPLRIPGTDQCEISVEIHSSPTGVSSKPFYDGKFTGTEEEAVNHCLAFGKRIIDGQVKNCSIRDL